MTSTCIYIILLLLLYIIIKLQEKNIYVEIDFSLTVFIYLFIYLIFFRDRYFATNVKYIIPITKINQFKSTVLYGTVIFHLIYAIVFHFIFLMKY